MFPHHGLKKWVIVHTFYNGLNYSTSLTIDTTVRGALMKKSIEDALSLIEDITLNYHQWPTERYASSRPTIKYDSDILQSLAGKVDSLT